MSEINTINGLLRAAMQDLCAGAEMLAEHLPELRKAVTEPSLASAFLAIGHDSKGDAGRLLATGLAEGGPANLWMAGILEDADRDARSTAPGPLLDTALIGAIRKGLASAIVSYETAVALAHTAGDQQAATVAEDCRRRTIGHDRALAALLREVQRTLALGKPDQT